MDADLIRSTDNRWIKRVRRAAERHEEEIVLEGPKQIGDAIGNGWTPLSVLVREGTEAPSGSEPRRTHIVSERAFKTIAETSTSQGVVALFERPAESAYDIMSGSGPIVVLDGVQDPGNVGAIVRLATAFGASGVIVTPGSADPLSPRAIRGSAGTVLGLPIARLTTSEIVEIADTRNRKLFVAMPAGPSIRGGIETNGIIVFGSEGQGVSQALIDAGTPFSIPTVVGIESLNVASAAAIALWELSYRGEQ